MTILRGSLMCWLTLLLSLAQNYLVRYGPRCSIEYLLTLVVVSAVGVPPREVVDKLHKNGILYAVSSTAAGIGHQPD